MRGPKPTPLALLSSERHALEQLVRRHTTPQHLALRARIILDADAGLTNAEIARRQGVCLPTVRLWRTRWLGLQAVCECDLSVEERLSDAPRSGAPVSISAEQVCQIVALACEPPAEGRRPISHWTSRELADEIQARGIVSSISARHAARLLKRGISNPI